jgi:putative hemolysin
VQNFVGLEINSPVSGAIRHRYIGLLREDGSWFLDGLIPIPELKDRLGLKHVPEEDKGRYHTLSGLMMWLSGQLPHTGDVLTWEGWRLEVVDLDGKRIDKILAIPIPPAEVAHSDTAAEPD